MSSIEQLRKSIFQQQRLGHSIQYLRWSSDLRDKVVASNRASSIIEFIQPEPGQTEPGLKIWGILTHVDDSLTGDNFAIEAS